MAQTAASVKPGRDHIVAINPNAPLDYYLLYRPNAAPVSSRGALTYCMARALTNTLTGLAPATGGIAAVPRTYRIRTDDSKMYWLTGYLSRFS